MIKTFKTLFTRQKASASVTREPSWLGRKVVNWLQRQEQRLSPSERKGVMLVGCLLAALFFGQLLLNNLNGKTTRQGVSASGIITPPDLNVPGDTVRISDAWLRLQQYTDSIHY